MPSITHEAPLDIVRQRPDLAVDLLQGIPGITLPRRAAASLAPTDMSAAVPVQYLADMVVLVSDAATGDPALAVIIEPQLRDSETKRYSWPVYLTTARRITHCPAAVLVVICPDPAEAAKCGQLIRTGHPGFDLAPIVCNRDTPPGPGGPFLTLLTASMGAIDLETEPGAQQVVDALASPELTDDDRLHMTAIILTLATDAARQNLKAMMTTAKYERTFLDDIHDQGIAEGEAKGEAKAVLRLLDARGIAVSPEQRDRVTACADGAQLDLWFDRAITAATAAEVFAD